MYDTYAIIDIGSNTIRLVIYKYEKIGRFKEIENIKVVARLRNYLNEKLELSSKGINLLIKTIVHFEEITKFHHVINIRCVATAAIRHASNKEEIVSKIEEKTSFKIRVLSDFEEAYYGYLSVVNSTPLLDGITVDIGGGSTEVTLFKNRDLIEYHSFPFGALSLKQQFIKNNVPTERELQKLADFLEKEVAKLDWIQNKNLPLIGIGGSARNIAQLNQSLQSYPLSGLHQYEMTGYEMQDVYQYLLSKSFDQLKKTDGLSEDRADIIIPAVIVFSTFYKKINAHSFILSRKGLRDGVFYEQLLKPYDIKIFPNVVEESLYELMNEYNIQLDHVIQLTKLAKKLFVHLKESGYVPFNHEDMQFLKHAAKIFYLGDFIDSESSSQHTFYVLANRTIDGFMHKDRMKLALIASYKSKSAFKQYLATSKDWLTKEELKKIRLLGIILKIAYSLNLTKRNIVDDIKISTDEDGIVFEIFCNQNWFAEKYQVEKQKKHLSKALKVNVSFYFREIKKI